METKYVMRQVDNLIYLISDDKATWLGSFNKNIDHNDLRTIADVIIDADSRVVIKARYF